MKWLTSFFWWVISPFSSYRVIIICKAQGFKSELTKGSGMIVCVLLLLLITSIIIISLWPWASPAGFSLLSISYVCCKIFGADLVVWWSRPTVTGLYSTSRPVGAAIQLLERGLTDRFNGRSFGKANAAVLSVSSWGTVAVCCRAKQGPSCTWQHFTGLGREQFCSASTYRFLCCERRDTPGELVQEPTGKRRLGRTSSSVLRELYHRLIRLISRTFPSRTDW